MRLILLPLLLLTSQALICQGFSAHPRSTSSLTSSCSSPSSLTKEHAITSNARRTVLLFSTKEDQEQKEDQDKRTDRRVEGISREADDLVKDHFESSLDELKEMIQDDGMIQDFTSSELLGEDANQQEVALQQQQQQENGNKDVLLASTSNSDPFFHWIEADVSDPIMKIFSSELGVQSFVDTSIQPFRKNNNDKLPDSSQLPLDVILARSMDTLEDIALHLARIPYETGDAELTPEMEATRKTVVILGSGWAAHALMKVADSAKLRLIVVSPANHFVFTPMLASSAVGTVEYRSMTEAVRSANPMIDDYLEGKATAVNVQNKTVTVQLNSLLENYREGYPPIVQLDYDHLIVSVGCRVDDKGVPGADKAFKLKTTDDAVKLRTAIGECFEYASRPDVVGPAHAEERRKRATFLIVGGGPTGVELAGEILDLAADITRPHKGAYPRLNGDIQVVLAHSGPELVPQFEKRLRNEARKSLERKGAKVYLNTRVNEVGDGFAALSTKVLDPDTGEVVSREELTLPTGLTAWCAGTAPVSFVSQLLEQLPEEARNHDGRIKVDKWLRPQMPTNELMGSVLVMGDAAAFPESDEQITNDKLLPQTAQVAGQQGAYAARMLARGYDITATPPVLKCTEGPEECDIYYDPLMIQWLQVRGITTAPQFVFLNLGLLAYLGGGEALSQIQIGDFPLFSYFGSIAYVLWRSVYLVKQVATRNRVLVTFDWIKSAIFGRDMTRF
jgi:NADH dehydrogenase FAD-containing subunit